MISFNGAQKGIVLDTHFPKGTEPTEELARQLSELMVDSLVALHAIPYQDTPLKDIVKPDGFLERQVYGWIERYENAKTAEHAEIAMLTDWLKTIFRPIMRQPLFITIIN